MKTLLSDPSASFYTTGSGLRGAPVIVMDKDTGVVTYARVYSNTATQLKLDVELPRNPDRFDSYVIGSIPVVIESGDLTFGSAREVKSIHYFTFQYERGGRGSIALYLASDQASETSTAWQLAGYAGLTGPGYYRMPVEIPAGTGRVIRYTILAMMPGQPFTLTNFSITMEREGNFV